MHLGDLALPRSASYRSEITVLQTVRGFEDRVCRQQQLLYLKSHEQEQMQLHFEQGNRKPLLQDYDQQRHALESFPY